MISFEIFFSIVQLESTTVMLMILSKLIPFIVIDVFVNMKAEFGWKL
jgi:hypothetical protein